MTRIYSVGFSPKGPHGQVFNAVQWTDVEAASPRHALHVAVAESDIGKEWHRVGGEYEAWVLLWTDPASGHRYIQHYDLNSVPRPEPAPVVAL